MNKNIDVLKDWRREIYSFTQTDILSFKTYIFIQAGTILIFIFKTYILSIKTYILSFKTYMFIQTGTILIFHSKHIFLHSKRIFVHTKTIFFHSKRTFVNSKRTFVESKHTFFHSNWHRSLKTYIRSHKLICICNFVFF